MMAEWTYELEGIVDDEILDHSRRDYILVKPRIADVRERLCNESF